MSLYRMEKIAVVFLGIALFAVTSGMTSAYLTSYPEQLQNRIAPGFLGIELTEPDWNPSRAEALTPRSIVPKDPAPVNTGDTPVWMFLRVSIPIRNISLVDLQTCRRLEAAETELFSFTPLSGWELITQEEKGDQMQYVFGFREIVEPGQMTEPLFEQVTMVNYLEGELKETDTFEIPVEAVSIQSNVCEEGTPLAEVYQIYLQQETDMTDSTKGDAGV